VTRPAPFGFSRVVFLSHVLRAGTPVFPGDPPVEVHQAATVERDGYHLQAVATGEQSGTHWAAPAHFHPGTAAADELDPADFFFPAVLLDMRAEVKEDADFTLGRTEIEKWEANFGPIPPGGAVIMWTGFEDRWDDPAAYLNADHEHRIHLENLAGLGEMPAAGGWVIVGGIRVRGGSGSPATVFGLIP
jgi:kynurenine formamidase